MKSEQNIYRGNVELLYVMMTDLILDSEIRAWVFLPIVLITFLMGILQYHISILLTTTKLEKRQFQDSQLILRARILHENAKYLPKNVFLIRREAFTKEKVGFLKQKQTNNLPNNMNPSLMMDLLKSNVANILPMIIVGSWINWMFSGCLTTRVPFPLTLKFKSMLQRGIELPLDASWVSSASWYFLNVFGLKKIYLLILDDPCQNYSDQIGGMVMSTQMSKELCKAEWETLELVEHEWALADIEKSLRNQ